MQISKINFIKQQNFKGLEAQHLKAIYVQGDEFLGGEALFEQLSAIAQVHKIQVLKTYYKTPWIQDHITFTPDGRVLTEDIEAGREFAKTHRLRFDKIIDRKTGYLHHADGGNLFFVTDKDGKRVAITAENYFHKCEARGFEEFYDVDRIIELPRADYHADLFITPIGDNKILVADDTMTLSNMLKMVEKIEKYIKENPDDKENKKYALISTRLLTLTKKYMQAKAKYAANGALNDAARILENEGFEVIRVPSVVYKSYQEVNDLNWNLRYDLNYSNALTYKNEDDEVIYITAKSPLDDILGINKEVQEKIGIGFEKMFIESVQPHIKPENIHFILGDENFPIHAMLSEHKGGLHCMCAEVPDIECY